MFLKNKNKEMALTYRKILFKDKYLVVLSMKKVNLLTDNFKTIVKKYAIK